MNSATRRSLEWYWKSKTNRKRQNKQQVNRRLKNVINGLCYTCKQPRDSKAVNCVSCRIKLAERIKSRRIDRAEHNECVNCGSSLGILKTSRCISCLEKNRDYMRRKNERTRRNPSSNSAN